MAAISASPSSPSTGLVHTGLLSPEVVALEDSAGVGYGRTRREIEDLVVKDAVEDILSSLSTDVWAAGWYADMPSAAWDLLFALPDPDYPFASATHEAVAVQLVRLLELTVAHGWWPFELSEPDERGSRIRPFSLAEWNNSRPENHRIEATAVQQILRQLTPRPAK